MNHITKQLNLSAMDRNITNDNHTGVRNTREYVEKRFPLEKEVNSRVEKYRRKLSVDSEKELTWPEALIELINTHPRTKNL